MAFPRDMVRPLSLKRWMQPKLVPSASLTKVEADLFAHVARYRRKHIYSHHGQVVAIPNSVDTLGDLEGPRFYCHTGFLAKRLVFKLGLARPNYTEPETVPEGPANPLIRITCVGGTSGTQVKDISHGLSGGGTSLDVPDEWSWPRETFDITAQEDVHVRVQLINEARLITLLCYEEASQSEAEYVLANMRADITSPIHHKHRRELAQNSTAMWKSNGAHLWNWWDHRAASGVSSSSYTDIKTGWVLETTNHRTIAQATVPVKFAVYAQTTAGSGGKAKLINASGGATIAEIMGIGTTAQWYTATGTIPAGTTTVTLQTACDGTNFIVATNASLFEYQA